MWSLALDYNVQKERFNNFIREAEQERLAKLCRQGQHPPMNKGRRYVLYLVTLLTVIGWGLARN